MARVGKRSGKNFGYGRQLSYAGRQALQDMHGNGHYGTVKAHGDRWQPFVEWNRSEGGPGVNEARHISGQIAADYVAYLRGQLKRGEISASTALNRISSFNQTMAALRGDQHVKVSSPSKALGMQRCNVRKTAPHGQDRGQVRQNVDALSRDGQLRVAAIVQLARSTGMRFREAVLADLPRLCREADRLGKINIQDGTKGGRAGASAPRWIAVDEQIRDALAFAVQVSPKGSRNMVVPSESYKEFVQRLVGPARDVLHTHSLKGFHELRAAFACERYEQITQHRAPVNGGQCYSIDRRLDREARMQISRELGHGRIDVVASYIGGRV